MTGGRHARIQELFLAACERPPVDRGPFLEHACRDESLRREVESVLRHHRDQTATGSCGLSAFFDLETPPVVETATASPEEVGEYRLLRRLGEGGMGEVWEAEQQEPVRRRVALKLIKRGMDTREVLARFESERQALALMNHPSIASIYGAGATPEGRPYFVMEYVSGVPITEYCDTQRLAVRERVELFIEICRGVQHAHQKGIIHRDVKPSNVLVAVEDGTPVPKIIDFGVAKATAHRLTERTLFTDLGQWIGTPEYMSPEQAEMTSLDVDTRTDVYSLGALLYELLAGTQPFSPQELRRVGFDEMRRRIREDEPTRPSTRVSSLDTAAEVAGRRRSDLAILARELRGDLDWITMKALEKDRTRRYGSPAELAADLLRYLGHQPVSASPPSAFYRMRKFVRRHRAGVLAATVAATALLIGGATTTLGFVRASREAESARRVAEVLADVFEVLDPGDPRYGPVSAEDILARGAERIDRELRDQPLVRARLKTTIGRVYGNLAHYREAGPLLEDAFELRHELLGPEHPEVAETLHDLGWLRNRTGDYSGALELHRRALEIHERAYDSSHPAVGRSLHELAFALWRVGDYQAAKPLYERALEIRERALGAGHLEVADTLYAQGILLASLGDHQAAERGFVRALEIREKALGPGHTAVAWALHELARLRHVTGAYDEARTLFERALAIQTETLGAEHPSTVFPLHGLALVAGRLGERERALRLLEKGLEIRRQSLGPDHPDVAESLRGLATLALWDGDEHTVEPLLRRILEIREAAFGSDHPSVAWPLFQLGWTLRSAGRENQARALVERALAIWERSFGPEHPSVATALKELAILHRNADEHARARELLERSLRIRERAYGPDHPAVSGSLNSLAVVHWKLGELDRAESLFERAITVREAALGTDHPEVALMVSNLASLAVDLGELERARSLFERALAIYERAGFEPEDRRVAYVLEGQGKLAAATGDLRELRALRERALVIRKRRQGPEHRDVASTLEGYAELLRSLGRDSEAEPLAERAATIRKKNESAVP